MTTNHVPFDIPEDLRRGLAVEAARSGKSQSRIVAEALEKAGIDRVSYQADYIGDNRLDLLRLVVERKQRHLQKFVGSLVG